MKVSRSLSTTHSTSIDPAEPQTTFNLSTPFSRDREEYCLFLFNVSKTVPPGAGSHLQQNLTAFCIRKGLRRAAGVQQPTPRRRCQQCQRCQSRARDCQKTSAGSPYQSRWLQFGYRSTVREHLEIRAKGSKQAQVVR